ncbi:hypothetical protein HPIN_04560 [Helicobacter pylori India7]|uniref:Uncharacterized protein n=1 Tax=Helicobacter pylori (strain India7) TaxID=907238 RepID=E8QGM0_HELP7|nr:hypothetical protein HPIN_04560 [Helicobacter pylori India7]
MGFIKTKLNHRFTTKRNKKHQNQKNDKIFPK